MAKLNRVTQKVFGSNAGFHQVAQFGSLFAGTPTFTTDLSTIQALSNYLVGWYEAAIGGNSPAIQDMNALFYLITSQMAYQFQEGIPEWDASTTYYKGSMVNVPGWSFTVTSANATVGATYTNNGNTYTVTRTISSGTTLVVIGTGSPLTSGTLTKATGTGDATITFSANVANSAIYTSLIDANTGNAVTNTADWTIALPSFGLPFQHIAMNAAGNSADYTYANYGTQTSTADVTVPAGINKMVGFYTISTGNTYTINGSMTCIGPLKVNGTLITNGTVRIV